MGSTQMSIHDNQLADMSDLPMYPIHHFCRAGESDTDWIIRQMRHVPIDKQQGVIDEYHKLLHQTNGRKLANTYCMVWLKSID